MPAISGHRMAFTAMQATSVSAHLGEPFLGQFSRHFIATGTRRHGQSIGNPSIWPTSPTKTRVIPESPRTLRKNNPHRAAVCCVLVHRAVAPAGGSTSLA